MASVLKRLLLGKPLASADEEHQRLFKVFALAIFASDAISSTAYATEEILHVLVPIAAAEALDFLIPISIVVTVLLVIVVSSYRQVIHAYPSGGGSYVVAQDNLGEKPALVAAASLLVDYTLTVAVSISAGTAAITSAFPELRDHRVALCLSFIGLLMLANLRGLKESARIFAAPTYVYVGLLVFLIVYGLYRSYAGGLEALPEVTERYDEFTQDGRLLTGVTLYALMRAFSSGAVALTGVEAISNGVPAFHAPKSKNASTTLVWMGAILASAFFGLSLLAHHLKPTLSDEETILSILAGAVWGDGTVLYYTFQAATALILLLAANTAFAGFPQIASILAKDGYLPRQLHNRGDRLVYSNGIVALALVAGLLIVVFGGVTTLLIPLYAVGVFCGFTLAQAGMVRYHRRVQAPGWQRGRVINAIGCVATAIILVVVVVSKFVIGAWVPVVLIPAIAAVLIRVKRHYDRVEAALEVPETYRSRRHTHTVVVLVGRVHRATLAAISYARSLAPDRLVALSVVSDAEAAESIQEQWDRFDLPVALHILSSPYRELAGPVLEYLDELDAESDNDVITVILPEFVLTKWYEQLLHNQSALVLKARLLFRRNTVVVSVPYQIDGSRVAVPGVMEGPARAATGDDDQPRSV
ncbi:MAG: APC family permease [Actinomycetota bacterium]|nr:APC family permease [Acidimicrobiia bacterium]MDQ3293136.1 APC family permease [Actinomycetota bacterium]